MYSFTPKYIIGDVVYHNSTDGDRGIIVDISYAVRYNSIKYEVISGRNPDDDMWCVEEELSDSKVF